MRFLDANVFIYAYYKPKRQLTQKEKQMKEYAKKIISNVSQGKEEVTMTVVHVSEIVNILKHGMPLDQLITVIRGLFMLDNVKIMSITREAYFAATELGDDLKLEANDDEAIDDFNVDVKDLKDLQEELKSVEERIKELKKMVEQGEGT